MKTVSQNTPTIYSATTPENNPPQLVASLVPDEQRISFWPQHFGLIPQWVTRSPVSSAGWTVCAKTTAVVSGICTP